MHKLLNLSEMGYLEIQVHLTLPYQEDSGRVGQVLAEVAEGIPYIYPRAKRSREKTVKLPVGIKAVGDTPSVELPPARLLPKVRMVKATQDGIEYQVSMWTPFYEKRNEIISDYLQQSIERLSAANLSLKDTSPFPAPRPGSQSVP
jgi:small-conductance mechanosensitive channel